MRRILLFDTIIDGHHPDYLCHLISYWLHTQPEGELVVATPASFEPIFRQLHEKAPEVTTIQFVPIEQSEIDFTRQGSMIRRSFREWNLLLSYSQRYQATHVLLMYFDIFQLGLWLGRKATSRVSGIYFRPDFHYTRATGLKSYLNKLRKKLTLRGLLNQGALTNLFCLDHSAVPLLNEINTQVNVIALPDPVKSYPITTAESEALRSELQIDPDRNVFLLFGYLDDRKGIEPVLDALKQLNPAAQEKICFLLVGAIQPDYQVKIEHQIAEVGPNVQIVTVFKEIKGRSIQLYFDVSDYVLALYQRHVGMASVIIRAAISGKPLIASDYGYVGHVVSQKQLGIVTDSTSPEAISQVLEQVLTEGMTYSSKNLQEVADQNSDVSFAKTIFDNLV
ncbi:hypothetical protein GCM10028805_15090 [Spirosoma harenae]